MAAKETLTIEVLTQQAQKNVDALNKSLGGLKSAIAGLAITALIRNTLLFADSIQDVADKTKIANATLIGFANTVAANGGTFDNAMMAVVRFSNSLGEAVNGSQKARDAFRQLGISTEEIISGNADELLTKTISKLAELEKQNANLATSLGQDIFSKSLNLASFEKINAGFAGAVVEAQRYASAQKAVANLQDKLDRSFIKLQFSILKALEPLAKKIGEIPQEKLDKLIESFVEIGKAIGSLVVVGKVFSIIGSGIVGILGYLALFKQGAEGVAKTGDYLATQWKGFKKAFEAATTVMGKFKEIAYTVWIFLSKRVVQTTLALARMVPYLAAITGALYAINEAVKFAFDIDIIGTFIDYVTEAAKTVGSWVGLYDEAKAKQEEAARLAKEQADKEKEKAKQILENLFAIQEYNKEVAKTVDEVTRQNQQYIDQVKFLKDISKLSKDQQEIEVAKRDAVKGIDDAVYKLRQQQQDLKDSSGEWLDGVQVGEGKYKALEEAINKILGQKAALKKAAMDEVALTQQQRIETDKQAHAIAMLQEEYQFEEANRQLEENLSLLGLSKKALEDATRAIQYQRDVRKIMLDFDTKLLELQQKQGELGEENFKRELAQLQELTAARLRAAQASAQAAQTEADAATPTTWIEGWQKAYEDFVNNIPTVAEQGMNAFKTFTQGLTDAFVNFAKTGKLSFKDLINNIIAQIVQSKVQDMIARLLNPQSATGSVVQKIFSKIFGFAEGGRPPKNKPSIIGEKGPEIFVPDIAGTIIPNDTLKNIMAMNKSMGSMGKSIKAFANGGMPSVNKPNLVGERGPEMFVPRSIVAPAVNREASAPIYNNYVTNNINAIDSKSVAQVFAENRKTLLGTIQMAQKEMPR